MKNLIFLFLALFIFACNTDSEGNPCIYEPTLSTEAVTDITETSATLNGIIAIVSENCDVPNNTEQGFVYSTEIQPTLEDTQVNVNGTNISTTVEGLTPNTTYYFRAFLTNNLGDFYGDEVSFITVAGQVIINTLPISNITTNSATSGGEIVSDGNTNITAKGVCWGLNNSPTVDDNFTNNNDSTTTFESVIEGLSPNTEYFVRAFATNEFDTYYGDEVSFSTELDLTPPVITIIGDNPLEINIGEDYTEFGASATDDIDGDITQDILIDSSNLNTTLAGVYTVTYSVSDLSNNSTIEIREVIVIDNSITDQDGNTYDFLTYGDQVWTVDNAEMVTYRDGTPIPQVTDKTEWSTLTTGAWCYKDNDPTKPRLYNWYAVMGIHDTDPNTPDKEFAPEGWHVPTDTEWTTLKEHLIANGYNYIAKAMASTTGWINSTNAGAPGNDQSSNNSSGFNAFPVGTRNYEGTFNDDGSSAFFWSSTEFNTNEALMRNLNKNVSYLIRNPYYKLFGFSVRFVRD